MCIHLSLSVAAKLTRLSADCKNVAQISTQLSATPLSVGVSGRFHHLTFGI